MGKPHRTEKYIFPSKPFSLVATIEVCVPAKAAAGDFFHCAAEPALVTSFRSIIKGFPFAVDDQATDTYGIFIKVCILDYFFQFNAKIFATQPFRSFPPLL